MPAHDPAKTLTSKELGEKVDRTRETINKWIRNGSIKAVRIGREYRISKADANAWWRSRGGGVLFPEADIGELPDDDAEGGQR